MKGFLLRRSLFSLLLFTVLAWTLASCGGGDNTSTTSNGSNTAQQSNCVNSNITTSGSSTLSRLVQNVVDKYEAKCPNASVTVNFTNSKAGLADVESGKADIGVSDILADKTTQTDLVDHPVAVAPFAIKLNKDVGLKNLTTAQVKGIYTGQITNWKDVGGPDMNIFIVDQPTGSGTRVAFEQYVLGGPETITVPASQTSDRNGTINNYISQNAGAIGYSNLSSYGNDSNVVTATLDGNAPTSDLVKNNTYKFWSIEHMYTKGQPNALAQALINYTTSPENKDLFSRRNLVALGDMDQAALKTH